MAHDVGSNAAKAVSFIDGEWRDGNVPIIGAMDHAAWLGSIVFDGARAFEGVTPDLDRHCERVVASARALGLEPMVSPGEIADLSLDGVNRFPAGTALYIRPLFFAATGLHILIPDPASTRFVLTVFEAPMPSDAGFSACMTSLRRPTPEAAPTDAKAACHYPNGARAVAQAREKGFENAVIGDPDGNVAEFTSSNLFLAKDGVAATPAANGTFLAGVTRRRVLELLEGDGIKVETRTIAPEELETADEIFSTGNYGKVQPVIRYNDRDLQPGPVYQRARELYWNFAHSR